MATSVISTHSNTIHRVMTTIVPESPILPPAFETLRIPSEELASYPKLSALTDLINDAFTIAGRQHPGFYDPEEKRFKDPSEFLWELGLESVVFVTFVSRGENFGDEPEMVATTSYTPFSRLLTTSKLREACEALEAEQQAQNGKIDYKSPTSKNDAVPGLEAKVEQEPQLCNYTQSATSVEDDSQADAFKVGISCVAVAPAWQKHGLSSKLLGNIVEEIRLQAIAHGKKDFTLVLNTMKEINGPYWTKKGFKVIEEEGFPPGLFGSTTGFTFLRMSRHHLVG